MEASVQTQKQLEIVADEIELKPDKSTIVGAFLNEFRMAESEYLEAKSTLKLKQGSIYLQADFKELGCTNKESRDGHVNMVTKNRVILRDLCQERYNNFLRQYDVLMEFKGELTDFKMLANPSPVELDEEIIKTRAIIIKKK